MKFIKAAAFAVGIAVLLTGCSGENTAGGGDPLYSSGLCMFKSGDKYGYLNEIVIEAQFDDAKPFKNKNAAVKVNGKYGFINTSGDFTATPQFDEAESFDGKYPALVKIGTKYGYVDNSGKYLVNPQFDEAEPFNSIGRAVVKADGKYGVIDPSGKYTAQPEYDMIGEFGDNGMAAFKLNGKMGYIDSSGRTVISAMYDDAQVFSEGLAAVMTDNGYGFINESGELVIPGQFDKCSVFSGGFCAVMLGGKWGYINTEGKYTVNPMYKSAMDYSEEFGCVGLPDGKHFSFVDAEGALVGSQWTKQPTPFSGGYAAVCGDSGKMTLVDTQFTAVTSEYDEVVGLFSDGYYIFREDGKYGASKLEGTGGTSAAYDRLYK